MQTIDKKIQIPIERRVASAASYLFMFKGISQLVSWVFTFLVARILVPSDYGLMTMATTITSYAAIFSNLGLGSAIVQRKSVNQQELSSVFWFSVVFGCFMGFVAYLLSYPTSLLFHEPRVLALTKTVAILFIIEGIQIVPLSLLMRNLQFKLSGFTESMGVILSTIAIYLFALAGFGVWSLLYGYILKSIFNLCLYFYFSKWKPSMYLDLANVKGYVSFGIKVMVGGTISHSIRFVERFFTGRSWSVDQFGQFGFAKELSNLPTQRIVALINDVSFSGFAKLQDDLTRFKSMYLKIIKVTSTLVFPVFLGGFIIGDELIRVLLNEKWYPMITIFRFLCLTQIVVSINAINNSVHTALGKPDYVIIYNVFIFLSFIITYYLFLTPQLESILIPYFITFVVFNIGWIIFSLRKLKIPYLTYTKQIVHPLVASIIMGLVVFISDKASDSIDLSISTLLLLITKVVLGLIAYIGYYLLFARSELVMVQKFFKRKQSA